MEREREAEQRLVAGVKALGGRAYKWNSPGNAGVPDRIVILPGGYVFFVEVKRTGGEVRTVQRSQLKRLRRIGCSVWVLYGTEEVVEFLRMLEKRFKDWRQG